MPAGLPVAIMLLTAQATTTAPAAQQAPPAPDPHVAEKRCPTPALPPASGEIVICAERPHGYRLNPDVMEARREIRGGGRPKPPENYKDTSCAAVGPMGCGPQAGINLIGAALTAAEIASRLAKGQEVGSMFVTDPHPSEYQLYLDAKKRREDKEAAVAAKAAADAVKARVSAQTAKPAATVDPLSDQRD